MFVWQLTLFVLFMKDTLRKKVKNKQTNKNEHPVPENGDCVRTETCHL